MEARLEEINVCYESILWQARAVGIGVNVMLRSAIVCVSIMIAIVAGQPVRAADKSNRLDCPFPAGWAAVARQKADIVVFGELHGTEQSPRFIGQLACALAARGQRVLVAVEHGVTLAAAWQAAAQLPPGQFEAALAAKGWAGRADGIGSKAYFDMLVRLQLLKTRGLAVDVTPFAGFVDKAQNERFAHLPGQGGYEAAMAENIAKAAKAGKYDLVLVLVGNLHARKEAIVRGAVSFEPMTMQLARRAKVVSLDMRYGPGTSWICQLKPGVIPGPQRPVSADEMACGNSATAGYPGFFGSPRIELASDEQAGKPRPYDGVFWLGPVSGSAPLLR